MKRRRFKKPNEWQEFCDYISSKNRFYLTIKWKDFFKVLEETSKSRISILKKNYTMYRARAKTGIDPRLFRIIPCSDKELGVPEPRESVDNRANPAGIPYLYLASKLKTAISEIRPSFADLVSVGKYSFGKGKKVLSFFNDEKTYGLLQGFMDKQKPRIYSEEELENYVWGGINQSFSRPVKRGESSTDYVPTQIFSEFFKNKGVDAIVYKSSVHDEGYNIVIFDKSQVELLSKDVYKIDEINYECKKQ